MIVYRMSSIGPALPASWSYDGEEWVEGFQVLLVHQAAQAVLGMDIDGVYDERAGYDLVLVIELNEDADLVDAGAAFLAADHDDVISVRAVASAAFESWLREFIDRIEEDEGEEFDTAYLDNFDDEIAEWLTQNAEPVEWSIVDTSEE